jgi:hypothetical protein
MFPVMVGQKREARLRVRIPAIHVLDARSVKDVDARDKSGHGGLDRFVLVKALDERQYADPGGDDSAQANRQA